MALFKEIFDALLGKKEDQHPPLADYSLMVVDIHSHLIPGIDDGAKTMDDSIFLLRQLEAFGLKKIITSPHVMADGYTNTPEIILSGRDQVRKRINQWSKRGLLHEAASISDEPTFRFGAVYAMLVRVDYGNPSDTTKRVS